MSNHTECSPKTCQWAEDEDGHWYTSCAHAFSFIADGPTANGLKFCCYCGLALEELPYNGDPL